MTSDTDYLAHVLADGEWHSQREILERSFVDRGYGMTVHSRAATLRERGHTVQCDLRREGGRVVSFYRIVEARGGHGTQGEPAAANSSSGVETPAANADALSEAPAALPSVDGASLRASIPAVAEAAAEDAHPSRGGALSLFDTPRGAYGD